MIRFWIVRSPQRSCHAITVRLVPIAPAILDDTPHLSISLCVASRRPRAAWRHAHAHDLARAQSACAAGILGVRPADALGEKALTQDGKPTK
jgi:hypothetical protein